MYLFIELSEFSVAMMDIPSLVWRLDLNPISLYLK